MKETRRNVEPFDELNCVECDHHRLVRCKDGSIDVYCKVNGRFMDFIFFPYEIIEPSSCPLCEKSSQKGIRSFIEKIFKSL